jgi:hypothetical protein
MATAALYLAAGPVTRNPRNLPFRNLTLCPFVPPQSFGPHGNPGAAHTIFIRGLEVRLWHEGVAPRQLLAFPCTLTVSLHSFPFPFLEWNNADWLGFLCTCVFLSGTVLHGHMSVHTSFWGCSWAKSPLIAIIIKILNSIYIYSGANLTAQRRGTKSAQVRRKRQQIQITK